MVAHPERPKAALINRRQRRRITAEQTSPEPTRGGEEKWPPGQIFPFCPGAARPGRNQGAQHPAAPLACASGETGPTWIRDEAVEKGTPDRNETSRNSRMQVGPALPGAHAGEFSRQARPGCRGGKRVEARAASRNPESLRGAPPEGLGVPQGGHDRP